MPLSAILIITAFVSYSIGVWSERIAGRLKGWHLIFFWIGLATDASGTGMMAAIHGLFLNFHVITGIIALLLMFVHAVWASIVLLGKDERAILNFHKFSVFVWTIWLIPFFTGFFMAKRF